MESLKALRLRLGIADEEQDELLETLLKQAEEYVCGYTGRERVPAMLAGATIQLAAIAYRRRGMEGESAHSEGGLSMTAESLPRALESLLNRFRRARVI